MKITKLLVFILTFLICFAFVACGNKDAKENNTQSKSETLTKDSRFIVTVVDQNGDFVEGVILQVRKDFRVTARTNKEGVANFPLITTSGYKLSVVSCPDGYEYTGVTNIPIIKDTREFTLEITKK